MSNNRTQSREDAKEDIANAVFAYLWDEADEIVRDLARHTGDQVHDVLKRNGMLMRSSAGAMAMGVLAAVQVLEDTIAFGSKTAEEDMCRPMLQLFCECLPSEHRAVLLSFAASREANPS